MSTDEGSQNTQPPRGTLSRARSREASLCTDAVERGSISATASNPNSREASLCTNAVERIHFRPDYQPNQLRCRSISLRVSSSQF